MSGLRDVVRFQRPELPDQAEIDRYFSWSRDARWYSNFGPCVTEFELRVSAELLNGATAVTAGNATLGLMVALRAVLGKPRSGRDLLVVPSFTFIASMSAISWAGFRPVFVDIDEDDWQVAEHSLQRVLQEHGPRIAGALLTTTFGTPVPESKWEALERLLADHELPFVVDSAAGLGACLPSIAPRSATVYSLHATKPFAVGEGSIVASHDDSVARTVRELTNFGFDDQHEVGEDIGFNAKLPEILGATGLAVLDGFAATLADRRAHASSLLDQLADLPLSPQAGGRASPFQFVSVLCASPDDRSRLLAHAVASAVQVRTYFDPPMHRLPSFVDSPADRLGVTEDVASRIVALPMSNDLSESEVQRIVGVCRGVVG